MNYKNLITKLASMKKQAFLVWPADVSEEYKKDYLFALESIMESFFSKQIQTPGKVADLERWLSESIRVSNTDGAADGYRRGMEILQKLKRRVSPWDMSDAFKNQVAELLISDRDKKIGEA